MATHRCIAECFHNSHRYDVGEEATFNAGDVVPEHFEKIDGEDEPEAEEAASGKGGKRAGSGK